MIDMKIKTFLGIALAAGSLVSCSVEDSTSEASKINEDYTRNFIKQFGTINPNQDWSVVEQKSVSVDLPKASHVQIFEKQGGVYRLAADYQDVTKQTITFDGLEGDDTPFLVYVDDAAYAVENGKTLTIGSASAAKRGPVRAKKYPDNIGWINRGDKTVITLSSTDNTLQALSSNNGTSVALDYSTVTETASGNRGMFSKNVDVDFYPVYWNSPKKHTVGIYYNDENTSELVRIPVYADKTDTYIDDADKQDLGFFRSYDLVKSTRTAVPVQTDAENCWHYAKTTSLVGNSWDVQYEAGFKFCSRPYTIKPSASLAAGIYIEVDGKYYYSDPALNGGKSFFATRHISGGNGTDDTYTYYCFDDPDDNGNEGDKDYNDLVLYSPQDLTPISKNETEWTIACEDLGGTFDYDFNDLVFRVRHTAGNDYAILVPVAAGGTLPAQLFYNGKEISDEWHSHFGNGYESDVMINTGKGPEEHAVKTIRLNNLPTDWSIKALSNQSNGLSIKVKRADGTIASVTAPSNGSAPQMLILPYDWQWPIELTNIITAYPGFGTWGANYTDGAWVDTKVAESIISGFSEKEITANGQKVVDVTE